MKPSFLVLKDIGRVITPRFARAFARKMYYRLFLGYSRHRHTMMSALKNTEQIVDSKLLVPSVEHKQDPLVSVVITCYNYGKYIMEALESVLCSTINSYEVLVVNDGSTDIETINILHTIDHPKVKVIHQENQGLAQARNNGIKVAKGRYILPLDADDKIAPTMLEKLTGLLKVNPGYGIASCDIQVFGDTNEIWPAGHYNLHREIFDNHIPVCSLFRREAWEEVGGYNPNMRYGFEDWDFWISLGERGWYMICMHEPLFFYRRHGKSMIDDTMTKRKICIDQIEKNHHATYQEDYVRKLTRWWPRDREPNPLVSVIIPCYNHGKYLREAVESVVAQTMGNLEIIVVDDGSDDVYTKEIISGLHYRKLNKIIQQKNKGLPGARNTGIKIARGKYILCFDADDILETTYLEKTLDILLDNPRLGYAYTAVHFFGDEDLIWMPREFNLQILLDRNIPCATALFRKEAWEEAGGYNESMTSGYEDWDFWVALAEKGWYGKRVPEPLLNYRRHGETMVVAARKYHHEELTVKIHANHPEIYAAHKIGSKKDSTKDLVRKVAIAVLPHRVYRLLVRVYRAL